MKHFSQQKKQFDDNDIVLKISSQVLYRHLPFTIEVSASTKWMSQNQIKPEDILCAGLRMRVLKSKTNEEVKDCESCSKGRKILEIGVTSNQKFLEGRISNGKQIFVFDKCRSNCSSSRNHLKDYLYFSMDLINGVQITSQPFCIRSRVMAKKGGKDGEVQNKVIVKKVDEKIVVVSVFETLLNTHVIDEIQYRLINEVEMYSSMISSQNEDDQVGEMRKKDQQLIANPLNTVNNVNNGNSNQMNELKMLLTTLPFPVGTSPTTKTPVRHSSTNETTMRNIQQSQQMTSTRKTNEDVSHLIRFEIQKCENISVLYIHIPITYYKHCLSKLNEYVNSLADDLKNTIVVSHSC